MLRSPARRRGITLIEMLIAIAISLIVLLAVIQVFDQLNTAMNSSKATIEQAGELRNLTQRLQADLDGLTATTLPWTPADAGDGYFEYIEGPGRDSAQPTTYWGDRDDVIMFTARSKGKPFIGRFNGAIIESELAEIVWWTEQDLNGNSVASEFPAEVAVYRRVLLIRPDLNGNAALTGTPAAFRNDNDISVRSDGGTLVANSLADLTLRQNRVAHATSFPHAYSSLLPITGADAGIDLLLNKVSAFDVRVYDPVAPILPGTSVALSPGDAGYNPSTAPLPNAAGTSIGRGAFVDLNYAGNHPTPHANPRAVSFYSGPANAVSRPPGNAALPGTYSTWPEAYEHDGEDQDNDGAFDEGRDGFDTAGGTTAAADDPGETETFPPYPHPLTGQKFPGLRGVQVRVRLVEPDSRQVRQATVVADFLPE